MNRETLIQLVVEEVRRLLAERAASPQRLLVVLTGVPPNPDQLAAVLDRVGASNRFQSTLLFSHTAMANLNRSRFEESLRVAGPSVEEGCGPSATVLAFGADLVLVPWLSLNTAAKLALGICDRLVSSVLMLALLRGIPVVACAEEADPDGPLLEPWARPAAPLADLLRSHLNALRGYGVQLASRATLAETILSVVARPTPGPGLPGAPAPRHVPMPTPGTRPVITEADVKAAVAAGDPSRLSASGIWTPLAREAWARSGLLP